MQIKWPQFSFPWFCDAKKGKAVEWEKHCLVKGFGFLSYKLHWGVLSVLGFPMIRDSLVSQNKGIENSSLSRVKRQWDKLKILSWDEPGWNFDISPWDSRDITRFWNFATERAGTGFCQSENRGKKREKKRLQSVKFFFCFDNYIQFLGVRDLIVSNYIVDLGKVRTNNDFLVCFFLFKDLAHPLRNLGL